METNVKSTVAYALKGFLENVIATQLPNTAVIYDDELSVNSALVKLKSRNQMMDHTNIGLPLFAFKRSILKYSDEFNKRQRINVLGSKDSSSTNLFRCVFGTIDIDFLYIVTNMNDAENFEISYLAENGISSIKQFSLDIPDIGAADYYLVYNDLSDKSSFVENQYYKALAGNISLKGWYHTFKQSVNLVTTVNFKCFDYNDYLYFEKTIGG